jgi:hypothetical protein
METQMKIKTIKTYIESGYCPRVNVSIIAADDKGLEHYANRYLPFDTNADRILTVAKELLEEIVNPKPKTPFVPPQTPEGFKSATINEAKAALIYKKKVLRLNWCGDEWIDCGVVFYDREIVQHFAVEI